MFLNRRGDRYALGHDQRHGVYSDRDRSASILHPWRDHGSTNVYAGARANGRGRLGLQQVIRISTHDMKVNVAVRVRAREDRSWRALGMMVLSGGVQAREERRSTG